LTPVVDLRVSPAEPGQRFTSALVRFASKRDADDAIVVFDFYNFTSSCGATGSLRLERASYPDSHHRSTPESQKYCNGIDHSQLLNEVVKCEVGKQLGSSSSRTVSLLQRDTQKIPCVSQEVLVLLRQEQKLKKESDSLDIQLEMEKNTQEILRIQLELEKLGIRDHQEQT
jgi:hypothetical protein